MKLSKRASGIAALLLALAAIWWRLRAPLAEKNPSVATPQETEIATGNGSHETKTRAQDSPRPLSAALVTREADSDGELPYSNTDRCWNACGTPCSLVTGEPVCPKECDEDSECESDQLCTVAATQQDGQRKWRCQRSHCVIDDDCGPDKACTRMARPEGEIWLCLRSGLRAIGEPCAHDEFAPIGLCQRGLQCGNGICTPNECDIDSPDADAHCGPGALCSPTEVGMGTCSPECNTDDDCRGEETCGTHRTHLKKRCLRPHAFGCILSGCPDPKAECIIDSDGLTLKITSCMRRCESTTDCQEEEVCGVQEGSVNAFCYLECGGELGGCSEGWYCPTDKVMSEGRFVRTCVRDVLGSEEEFFELISKENKTGLTPPTP